MKNSKTIPVAVAAVFALTTAGAAFAQAGPGPQQGKRQAESEKIQMANYRHHGKGGGKGHMRGHRDGGGRGLYRLIETFDADGDGAVSQEEIITSRQTRLTEFDANNDGSLDISEYEALWLDAMRERMVDRFQAHDDDGDGMVTIEEFNENFATLVERRDRNDDGVLNADDIKRPDGKRGEGPHGEGPHGDGPRGDGPRGR